MRYRGGTRIARVLIEPRRHGVRLWLQLGWNDDCLVIESGTAEWDALFAGAGVEPPSDLSLDVGGDLREAVRELHGKVIGLEAVAA